MQLVVVYVVVAGAEAGPPSVVTWTIVVVVEAVAVADELGVPVVVD